MSSKVVSFYDWEHQFRAHNFIEKEEIKSVKKSNLNSIGMTDADFRRQVKKWKNKNL
ncbi:MAG: hypothetical protein ACFE9R_05175 [Candidatus Hermodarchaeota archaeon]